MTKCENDHLTFRTMSSQADSGEIIIDTMLTGYELDNSYLITSHSYTVHSSMSMLLANNLFDNSFSTIGTGAARFVSERTLHPLCHAQHTH